MNFPISGINWRSNPSGIEGHPKIVGYMSRDTNGKCTYDLSKLKYDTDYTSYEEKQVEFDLKDGYNNFIKKNVAPSNNIDELLRWVNLHSKQLKIRPDFISMRGVIIQLLLTLTLNRFKEGWVICAAKFNGIIYLCINPTKVKTDYEANMTEKQKKQTYWGSKFEQYILRDDPAKPTDTGKPINANGEFCCFFLNKFGNHHLLYAAEMDGIQSNEIVTEESILEDEIKFVELKVNEQVDEKSYRHRFLKAKAAKAWCQSYLSCVEQILFGFRTKGGILKELKRYPVDRVLELTNTTSVFDSKVAMNFCNQFLNHLKTVVTEEHDKCIYKFSFNPEERSHIKGEELKNENNQSEYNFLPEWYTLQLD